jgi:transposase
MHVQGQNRDLATLFPERLDDLIGEDNAVWVIDAFVDSLYLKTIANFRVDNQLALTRVCRAFVQFCRSQSLYGGDTIASMAASSRRTTIAPR